MGRIRKSGSAHLQLFTNLISVFRVYTKLETVSMDKFCPFLYYSFCNISLLSHFNCNNCACNKKAINWNNTPNSLHSQTLNTLSIIHRSGFDFRFLLQVQICTTALTGCRADILFHIIYIGNITVWPHHTSSNHDFNFELYSRF